MAGIAGGKAMSTATGLIGHVLAEKLPPHWVPAGIWPNKRYEVAEFQNGRAVRQEIGQV